MDNLIACPFCNFNYVHIESVQVNRGGEITEIGHEGTKLKSGAPAGRGSSVCITMWCESGHKWNHHLLFHKGQIETSDEILITGDASWQDYVEELWRD